MIIAIILAAGESRRMAGKSGEPILKQLLPYGKSTILETIIHTIQKSRIDQTVIVLGHQRNKIQPMIQKYPLHIIYNPQYKKGMLTSIQAGIRNALRLFPKITDMKKQDAIMIFLGDQPFINHSTIHKLIRSSRKYPQKILIPIHRKKRGHPVLLPRIYTKEILQIPVHKGLRELMQNHPDKIEEIPITKNSILRDIDTPEEYQREMKRLRRK